MVVEASRVARDAEVGEVSEVRRREMYHGRKMMELLYLYCEGHSYRFFCLSMYLLPKGCWCIPSLRECDTRALLRVRQVNVLVGARNSAALCTSDV